jgi:transmembrane sensor
LKNIDYFKRLVQKAQDKSISKSEMDELLQWLDDEEAAEYMPEICHLLGVEEKEADYSSQWQKLSDKIEEEDPDHAAILPLRRNYRITPAGRWAVAAAVLVLCSVLSVVMLKINRHPESLAVNSGAGKNTDVIVPGTKRAILITGNGNEITLDSSSDKMIVQGKNFSIQTNKNGQLVNNSTGSGKEIQINTVVTPPGGQYEVILPDGTAATLNAASSIKYPSAFQTDKREVKITGEVYFDVTHDSRKPFVVSTEKNMEIEVLGTSFNVNAYSNEPSVKTTLLEGAVSVTSDKAKQLLKPRDQAQLTDDGKLHLLTNVDVGSVVAWKNGVFEFNGTDIKTVMREISRWYNVDIAYEGNTPTDLFSAIINRQNSIDQVLTMLQNTLRVHFSIKNRTIYVSN